MKICIPTMDDRGREGMPSDHFGSAPFFTQKCVIRVEALNFPYNFCLAGPVHVTDIVMTCLLVEWDGVHVLHLAAHDFAGRMGSLDGNV